MTRWKKERRKMCERGFAPSAWTAADYAWRYGLYECRDCTCEMVFWMEHRDGIGRPHRVGLFERVFRSVAEFLWVRRERIEDFFREIVG